jgi:hypothetical protein
MLSSQGWMPESARETRIDGRLSTPSYPGKNQLSFCQATAPEKSRSDPETTLWVS